MTWRRRRWRCVAAASGVRRLPRRWRLPEGAVQWGGHRVWWESGAPPARPPTCACATRLLAIVHHVGLPPASGLVAQTHARPASTLRGGGGQEVGQGPLNGSAKAAPPIVPSLLLLSSGASPLSCLLVPTNLLGSTRQSTGSGSKLRLRGACSCPPTHVFVFVDAAGGWGDVGGLGLADAAGIGAVLVHVGGAVWRGGGRERGWMDEGARSGGGTGAPVADWGRGRRVLFCPAVPLSCRPPSLVCALVGGGPVVAVGVGVPAGLLTQAARLGAQLGNRAAGRAGQGGRASRGELEVSTRRPRCCTSSHLRSCRPFEHPR